MKHLPLDTRTFYDATKESIQHKKLTVREIKSEIRVLRKNGYLDAVRGVQLALSEKIRKAI